MATTALIEIEVESAVASTTTSLPTTKERRKNVIHIHLWTSLSLSLIVHSNSFCTLLIVNSSFIWIWKDFVRVCNYLELCFGTFWVIQILVWVILDSSFLESLLNLCICGLLFDSKHFIVIFFFLFFWVLLRCFIISFLLPLSLLLPLVELLIEASLLEPLCIDYAERWLPIVFN